MMFSMRSAAHIFLSTYILGSPTIMICTIRKNVGGVEGRSACCRKEKEEGGYIGWRSGKISNSVIASTVRQVANRALIERRQEQFARQVEKTRVPTQCTVHIMMSQGLTGRIEPMVEMIHCSHRTVYTNQTKCWDPIETERRGEK